MNRWLFFSFCVLVLYSCRDSDIPDNGFDTTVNKTYVELLHEWWIEYNKLDDSYLEIFMNDPEFITLCDKLDLRDYLVRMQNGETLDAVLKNYSDDFRKLLHYGEEAGVNNILCYKDYYLELKYPVCKDIIIEGRCELRDTWLMVHRTCVLAYQEGLIRYKGMLGCCERRFQKSIEQAAMYLPEAGIDLCQLYSYVVDPGLVDYECEQYVRLMDFIGIPALQRKNKLLELDRKISNIIMQIGLNQKFWVSCTCWENKPDPDVPPISPPTPTDPFPPFPDFDRDYPPEEIECSYETTVTVSINTNMILTFFDNLNLQWFIDQYKNNPNEYSMSFNNDPVTNVYSRTEPYTDNDPNSVTFHYKTNERIKTTTVIHNHPTGNPHSMRDALALANMNGKSNRSVVSSIVCTTNGDLYILYVKDPEKARLFYQNNSDKKDQLDGWYQWNVQLISRQMPYSEMEFSEMSMYATTAVLDRCDSGIKMLKMEGGVLKQKDATMFGNRLKMTTCK